MFPVLHAAPQKEGEDIGGEGGDLTYQPQVLDPAESQGSSLTCQEGLAEPVSLGRSAG